MTKRHLVKELGLNPYDQAQDLGVFQYQDHNDVLHEIVVPGAKLPHFALLLLQSCQARARIIFLIVINRKHQYDCR